MYEMLAYGSALLCTCNTLCMSAQGLPRQLYYVYVYVYLCLSIHMCVYGAVYAHTQRANLTCTRYDHRASQKHVPTCKYMKRCIPKCNCIKDRHAYSNICMTTILL